ncbi:MAG: aldo/keto reductase [Desulfovibrio fairfieldensis]
MKKRRLGKSGLEVSAIGMGCMGFSHGYGAVPSEGESIRLMRKAYDEYGCTLFDTAEVYATYANEELVGKALKPIRDNVILTTKFMPVFLPGQEIPEGKLSRKGLRNALESSLKRLQTEYIDLYYEHRVPEDSDPAEVAFWMGELIQEGKIRAWGQSEPTAEQIRIAHAVTPLAAVQNEYSLMQRRPEKEVLATCQELGIGFEAYSPMGGGFLSGKYDKDTKFTGDDVRRVITRYSRENMEANQSLLDLLRSYAAEKRATPAQLIALPGCCTKKTLSCPFPVRKDERLAENFGATDVALLSKSLPRSTRPWARSPYTATEKTATSSNRYGSILLFE